CSQCWQIYKEYFEVDEATKQFRIRFLKPGETDIAQGYQFSSAEAEEYRSMDFIAFLYPGSQPPSDKMVENSRESHFEMEKSGAAISGSQSQKNASETAARDADAETKKGMRHQNCSICASLKDYESGFQKGGEGTFLPRAAEKLIFLKDL